MVTSIYQDHNGFTWIGTYDGLNRYDGYTFKIFRNILTDTTSISNNQIRAIGEDGNNHLWIGTGKGINMYDPVKADFQHVKFKSWNNNVWQSLESGIRDIQKTDNRGLMLVGTSSAGLIVFEKNSYAGVQIPLLSWKGHEGTYDATAIAFDSTQQIAWVFVSHADLWWQGAADDSKRETRYNMRIHIGFYYCINLGNNPMPIAVFMKVIGGKTRAIGISTVFTIIYNISYRNVKHLNTLSLTIPQ